MEERTYTISELKALITESSTNFKAKIADGVESANKKENKSAYDSAKKKVKDFDGGGDEIKSNRKLTDKIDGNKTTLDVAIDGKIDDKKKADIEAQSKGYTSKLEQDNNIEKCGEFDDKTYKQFQKANKEMTKRTMELKKSGLTSSKMDDEIYKKENLYKESKKISVLNFKNTTFLNESQMISRIPDEYKFDGNRFKIKDAGSNEFIVEWKEGEANILSYENKVKLNESIEKFHKLSGYNSKEQFKNTTSKGRLNESSEFNKILNKTRDIIKGKN